MLIIIIKIQYPDEHVEYLVFTRVIFVVWGELTDSFPRFGGKFLILTK